MKESNMDEYDLRFIRAAINIARRARDNGNHPFGAVLVGEQGHILMEAENTVVTGKDCTGHAETNLMRQASSSLSEKSDPPNKDNLDVNFGHDQKIQNRRLRKNA
jgi:tRNA(Arg) A34 adenosine deaminase TadA